VRLQRNPRFALDHEMNAYGNPDDAEHEIAHRNDAVDYFDNWQLFINRQPVFVDPPEIVSKSSTSE